MTTQRAGRFEGDQAGSVTLFGVVAGLALLVLVGLVVDGGAKVRAVQRADAIAAEAARAGGQAILLPAAIQGQPPRVDPTAALAEANAFLGRRGVTGTVAVTGGGRSLDVQVETSSPTVFLGLIGISDLKATGHASAILIRGVTGALP